MVSDKQNIFFSNLIHSQHLLDNTVSLIMPIRLVSRLNHCPKLILADLNVKKHKYLIQINFEELWTGYFASSPSGGDH
jgi:hypothetical protein